MVPHRDYRHRKQNERKHDDSAGTPGNCASGDLVPAVLMDSFLITDLTLNGFCLLSVIFSDRRVGQVVEKPSGSLLFIAADPIPVFLHDNGIGDDNPSLFGIVAFCPCAVLPMRYGKQSGQIMTQFVNSQIQILAFFCFVRGLDVAKGFFCNGVAAVP